MQQKGLSKHSFTCPFAPPAPPGVPSENEKKSTNYYLFERTLFHEHERCKLTLYKAPGLRCQFELWDFPRTPDLLGLTFSPPAPDMVAIGTLCASLGDW